MTTEEIYKKGTIATLDELFNMVKDNAYDDGIDYSIGLQVLDNLIEQLKEQNK